MNEKDKQYIKPYKITFLKRYLESKSILELAEYLQVGSYTNKYRVDLIKDFEISNKEILKE